MNLLKSLSVQCQKDLILTPDHDIIVQIDGGKLFAQHLHEKLLEFNALDTVR